MFKLRFVLIVFALSCCVIVSSQQLTDSKLLTEAARICVSGSHEADECEVLAEASRRFEIPQLMDFIEMRKKKEEDPRCASLQNVTTALLDVALNRFGEGSQEAIKCRRAKMAAFYLTDYAITQALSKQNVAVAQQLSTAHAEDLQLQELCLLAQLEDMVIRMDRELDNPLIWEDTYRIEKQCDTLYLQLTNNSEERKEVYAYLGALKSANTSYNEYVNGLFLKFYPEGSPVEAKIYDTLTWTSSEAYLRMAYEMCVRLYGDQHPTTLSARLDQLNFAISHNLVDLEETHRELSTMLHRLKDYSARTEFLTFKAELMMWECDIRSNSRLYETDRYNTLLFNAASAYGSDSELYLNILNTVLGQRQAINIHQAQELSVQVERLVQQVYEHEPDIMARYLLDLYILKQGALSHVEFNDYISNLTGNYAANHHPSWASIAHGKLLADLLRKQLFKYEDAAMVFNMTLDDVGELVGKQHDVYALDLNLAVAYMIDSRQYEEAERLCLQGINDKLLDGELEPSFCSELCEIYAAKNDFAAGRKYAEQGIEASRRLNNEPWECHMQLELAHILLYNDEKERACTLFETAIPIFLSRSENITDFAADYFYINDYYQQSGQFAKAVEVLEDGFARYDAFFHYYDATYLRFIQEIYQLYAVQLDNYNHAEQFLEGHLKQLTTSPTTTNHDEILQLLWMHYDMLMRKDRSNIIKRFALLQDIQKETILICQRVNSTSFFDLKTWLMPILNELTSLVEEYFGNTSTELANMEGLILSAKDEEFKQYMEQFLEYSRQTMKRAEVMCTDELLPILTDFEKEIRDKNPDYLASWDYYDVAHDIATINLSVLKDSIEGSRLLRMLTDSPNEAIRGMAFYQVGNIALANCQYAQAAQHLETYRTILEKTAPNVLSRSSEKDLKTRLFTAYFYSGQKDKALPLARDISTLRSQLIHENLDMMTEGERQSYVSDDVSATALQMLLPDYPELLAEACYNSILDEKGLLLRTSASKRQSILQSGDTALIANLAQLDALNAEYRKLNTTNNWREGEYFVGRDVTDLNAQIEQLERQLNRDAAKYITAENTIPTWQQVQQTLKEGDAAIEFINPTEISCALVLLPDGQAPHYVALANSDSLYKEMEKLKTMRPRARAERMYQDDSLRLYARLWQPIEPLLQGVQRIYYSPTGYLNTLAFEAFRHPAGDYLIDHYDLRQLTSTAELTKPQHERPQQMDALLLGAAYYSPEQKATALDIANELASRGLDDDRGAIVDEDEYFGYLSYTADEVQQVEDIMQAAHVATTTHKGFDANESALVAVSGHSPYIMHLSTHGFFLPTDEDVMQNKYLARYPANRYSSMRRAGLALAGANASWAATSDEPENQDGILTADEVSRLDYRQTALAVLSACQTGVGLYNREGVFGMHRGFKQAGVTSVMATLWNVNDRSTAQMMSDFYRRWMTGAPIQQAFREAVLELRKKYPSPFYWAPFVLMDAKEDSRELRKFEKNRM